MSYIEVFSLLFLVAFIFNLIKRPRIGANEPPLVPYRYPIIGHTYEYMFDTEDFLQKCREQYGDPFSLYVLGSVKTFTGAETSHEVLKNSDIFNFGEAVARAFPFRDIISRFKDLDIEYTARVVHEHVSNKVNTYTPRMQKELLSGIEQYFGDCKEPKVFRNIQNTLAPLIAKPVTNVIVCEEAAQIDELLNSFTIVEREFDKIMVIPPILSFIHYSLHTNLIALPLKFGWNPITKHRDIFVKHCKPMVEERLRQRKELGEKYVQKDDLLDFFITDQLNKEDIVVDDKYMDELFGQIIAIVFASISTTTKFLSFALFDYGARPELWDEIYEEQLKIHNETNGILSLEDVHKMVKLDCFLRESFRHSSDIDREVLVYIKDSVFNDKFFGETANEFQPKRHIILHANGKIVHSQATKVDRSNLTFGGGKRACPGRFFAVNEIKMCLHKLILRYKIRTESGKIDPLKRLATHSFPPTTGLILENRN
ncbi:15121_t:CDS:10 [Cetraspora pellucida]|uniref:15121_t:CDS:1 n=1 Tax=Cetraspora pellucida TaxID=1433469 RepID=A0A9N9D2I2_9GLOM|nr:15121_t:CDS:10 [Cetraspora pellucida]